LKQDTQYIFDLKLEKEISHSFKEERAFVRYEQKVEVVDMKIERFHHPTVITFRYPRPDGLTGGPPLLQKGGKIRAHISPILCFKNRALTYFDEVCYSPRTAATPGSVFPSKYSNKAPPAVEI